MTLQAFTETQKQAYGLTGLDFCESELERKFMLMSSVAVALRRKGFLAAVGFFGDFCHIVVQDSNNAIVADEFSKDTSEQDLLKWLKSVLGE